MDYKKEFQRMLRSQTAIALATSVNGLPNVRIVNFYYDSDKKALYFSSFADNQKIAELEKNPHIAFTTITDSGEEHIRVKNGMARQSSISIEEIKDKFLAKLPEYIMSVPDVLPALVLFEITFESADVVLDFEHMDTLTI